MASNCQVYGGALDMGLDLGTIVHVLGLGPVHTPWVVATGTSFSQFKE
jgi:hypothetical protein